MLHPEPVSCTVQSVALTCACSRLLLQAVWRRSPAGDLLGHQRRVCNLHPDDDRRVHHAAQDHPRVVGLGERLPKLQPHVASVAEEAVALAFRGLCVMCLIVWLPDPRRP
jgi:hypothetical protein